MPIAFPIARYWRLVVPPVPRRLTIRRDGDSAVVMADGREIGFLHPYPVADWLQTLVQQVPHILASMEELATQRALYATALLAADPAAAKALSARLGVPLDGCSDVLWGVGDAVELAAHTLIDDEGDREPPPE